MNQEEIKFIQETEKDILRQVLKICEEHQLKYYMLGGTLLGAVRHGGFIPWDDDVDLGFPRSEYEKFITYAEEELKPPYQLHTALNDKGKYSYYYARVEDTRVLLNRSIAIKDVVIPAFVDIFPLDGVPDDIRKRKRWIRKCTFLHRLFSASQVLYKSNNNQTHRPMKPVEKALRNVFITLRMDRMLNTKLIWKQLDKALKENSYEESQNIINFCGHWKLKEMFPKTVYGEGKLYPFEEFMLNGPSDCDYVLSQMYGDYMKLPEESERENHHLELIRRNETKTDTPEKNHL